MKKMSAIVAFLSGIATTTAWAGTTVLNGAPLYSKNAIVFAVECSGEGPLSSQCGLFINSPPKGYYYTVEGVCTGSGGHGPTKLHVTGGDPSGLYTGCGWSVNDGQRGKWWLKGTIAVKLSWEGSPALKNSEIGVRTFVMDPDGKDLKVWTRGVLPDGTPIGDTLAGATPGSPYKLLGPERKFHGSSWAKPTENVTVTLDYPDSVRIDASRGNQAQILKTTYPVLVQASTTLTEVDITNEFGESAMGRSIMTQDKLTLTNNSTKKGQQTGEVILTVKLR